MKIGGRRRARLALSVLSLFTISQALSVQDALPASGAGIDQRTSADLNNAANIAEVKAVQRDNDHPPYDGKDGIPHNGPWVETNAARERKRKSKQANDNDDDAENDGEDDNDKAAPASTPTPAKIKSYEDGLKVKDIPKSNKGVMDDPNRKAPVEGTRGTEGGISQKTKNKESGAGLKEKPGLKKPDPPKEQPPLPHAENLRIKNKEESEDSVDLDPTDKLKETKKYIEKPTDLPEKPHSIPLPENPSSPKDYTIDPDTHSNYSPKKGTEPEAGDIIQPLHSLFLSFTMIIFSEIGDKTFLVACLMAMRHDRLVVFTAAFSALITMTVLSAVLGHAVPTLIPKNITNFLAASLFLVFGVKMLIEARKISPDEGVSEEMKEVEMELEEKEHAAQRRYSRHHRSSSNLVTPYMLESGRKLPSPPSSPSSTSSSRASSPTRRGVGANLKSMLSGLNNLFSLLLSPAWVQTFVMTFLGEWGDRSQIATIAMAAGQDYWWVTAGALGGHAICTGAAVIGGKAIAGRVSLRTVTMGGAIAFLVFGVIYMAEFLY